MKKIYCILVSLLCLAGFQTAWAEDGDPVDGQKFVLVNKYNQTGYMSRTSWDGAVYFLGESDSHYADYALTAQKNDDGTWSFYLVAGTNQAGEDSLNYLVVPATKCNLNVNSPEPVKWTLEKTDGWYTLTAGEGNNPNTIGLKLHLNEGAQYFVISEETDGGGYYPDYAGGTIENEDNEYGFDVDENGRAVMADNTSEYWQFLTVDEVPEFVATGEAKEAIQIIVDNFLDDEGVFYIDGFQATVDAANAILNSEDYNWEVDAQTIVDMCNKKEDFYGAIVEAEDIEDADDALTTAIANAKSTFNTATSVSEIEAAMEALQNAVNAFKEGTGDLTGMGTNMSFEDLSAQNGSETTGIAAPPVGWTVTINGTQVTTADEVKANGIANWHGVNSDCDGEGKDGNVAFGIWTSGVPTYEISQTIEGLECGTYTVSAGLMVGANTSGSRRTTQRIFGNLNSTYFATEAEYDLDLLDNAEVYAFADLAEPTTDRELQPITVRAYVYDGTLTFGLRTDGNYKAALRSSSNGAGGDGWFKLDNFRIQKEGYVGEDAAAVANHFIDAINELKDEAMQQTLKDEITALLDGQDQVTADTPQDDINSIITSLSSKMEDVQESVDAYERLNEAINDAYDAADEYAYYAGIDDFTALIEEAVDGYDEGTYDVAGVDEMIQKLTDGLAELKKSGAAVGTYLDVIQNGSFEDMSAQNGVESDGAQNPPAGWDLYFNGTQVATTADYAGAGASFGWCAINKGDGINVTDEEGVTHTQQPVDGTHLWGIWADNIPEVQLSQTISGLPAGTYVLSANVMVQNNWAGNCITTQRIFANDFVQMWSTEDTYALNLPDDAKAAQDRDNENAANDYVQHLTYAGYTCESGDRTTDLLKPMSLTFGLNDGEDLTLGFRTNNIKPSGEAANQGMGWFKVDNFRLFWQSEDVPTAIRSISTPAQQAEVVGQQYFTPDGAQISRPQRGITIVKTTFSDGTVKTTKVLR